MSLLSHRLSSIRKDGGPLHDCSRRSGEARLSASLLREILQNQQNSGIARQEARLLIVQKVFVWETDVVLLKYADKTIPTGQKAYMFSVYSRLKIAFTILSHFVGRLVRPIP